MALPESQMREIRLELYGRAKLIADAIEEIGEATCQREISEALRLLGWANSKFQAQVRNAQQMALHGKRQSSEFAEEE